MLLDVQLAARPDLAAGRARELVAAGVAAFGDLAATLR
jgi:hypothetical protein